MEKKILKYSVLRYSPSTVGGEKINLGILYFDEETGYREFRSTRRFKRIASFDDELDMNLVKALISGINSEIEGNIFTDYSSFDIEEYTKYYINDFAFDKPKSIYYEDLKEMMDRLFRSYFRFDFEKSQRPTKAEDKKLLESILATKDCDYSKDNYVLGEFEDRIRYDFKTENYIIKMFDFDDKNLSLLVNSAKTWAWNAQFSKNEIIIIYRYSNPKTKYQKEFNTIMRIFERANIQTVRIEDSFAALEKIS